MKQAIALSLFAFLLLLAGGVVPAVAAEGGETHGLSFMDWFWRFLNFGILVFVLVKYGGTALKDHLRQRRELIEKSIREAREAKDLAQKALAEVEERLRLKDRELAEIKAAAAGAGERERQRLIEDGERLKEKILAQARTNIDYELKRAKDAIRAEAAETALQLAEEKLKRSLTNDDQERLLQESLKLLGGKH